LDIDPRYAPAWRGLGVNLMNESGDGILPSDEGYTRAREAVEKALAIDPVYAAAHASLGAIAIEYDNDLAAAAKHLERALGLDATDVNVLSSAGRLLQNFGRLDEALSIYSAVLRRDPVDVTILGNLGNAQIRAGRLDSGIASFRTAL